MDTLFQFGLLLMTLLCVGVYGQKYGGATRQNQAQYFGSQPSSGLRSAPAAVNEPQQEDQRIQEQGINENQEQRNFLNFIQQHGLFNQQTPSAFQPQTQEVHQQIFGHLPQTNLKPEDNQQQRLLPTQQTIKPLFQVGQQSPQEQPGQPTQQIRQPQLGVAYSLATSVARTRFHGKYGSFSFR